MGFTQTAVDLSQRPGKPIVGNGARLSDQSSASWPLIVASLIIVAVGAWLTVVASGRHAWICPAAVAVLALAGDHAGELCDSESGGEDLVCPPVWRMILDQ